MRFRLMLLALSSMFVLPLAAPQTGTSAPTAPAPIAASAPTAVPALVPYSAVAIGADGKPLAGETSITFLIYKSDAGGEPLFAESQIVTLDWVGRYKAQIGASLPNGLPAELFATGEARWLEVQVAGQQSQPRILLTSVPYALKAADAATLGGLPASAFVLATSKTAAEVAASAAATSEAAANVTTAGGTAGFVPIFTGSAMVANSVLFQNANGIGINNDSPSAALDINGKAVVRGILDLSRSGNATPSAGFNSFPFLFQAAALDSSTGAARLPVFQWQAEPTGNNTASPGATFNLLTNNGAAPASTETGLYFNLNGTIHFAAGQTFPGGTGAITGVTAGTALTGGGTSGNVLLNLDTAKVPLLAAANHFTGNQTITGSLSATGTLSTSGQLISTVATGTAPLTVSSTTVIPNLNASLLGGLAPSAFASVAANNAFAAVQSFSRIGIGTTTPRSLLELSAKAPSALGPVFTLTNTGGSSGAEDALDFNTTLPSTTGTYNPMARIAAVDALMFSDNIVFQSNVPGSPNDGLQTNMTIQSDGRIEIGSGVYTSAVENSQLTVRGKFINNETGASYDGIDTFGGTCSGEYCQYDGPGAGIVAFGGEGSGSAGVFNGGTSLTYGGDAIDAFFGSGPAANGLAGSFTGDVAISGTLTAATKDFKIDHPLDPSNKYLVHASVESSEMMNIYSGNATTDELGLATIQLPAWFEAENTDFRYQLTTIGRQAQAWIAEEVANGQFKIATNASNVKVSWQITAVRQDVYAQAHPLVVEQEKPAHERGFYIHPELYGQPPEKQTEWGRHPQMMQKVKAKLGQTSAGK